MLNKSLHETALGKILYAFYTDSYLRSKLIFKGGTACHIFYGLPRFSTDLDFNIVPECDSEEAFTRMRTVIEDMDLVVKDAFHKRNTLFFLLSYKPKACNIKLEVNTRQFPFDHYSLMHYLGLPINVLDRQYIAAHKFAAITDRANMVMRDLFDAHFFLKDDWPIDEETIQYRTKKNLPAYFKLLASIIKKKQPIDILQGVGELLDEKQKQWVREHLVEELIFLLKLRSK